MIWCFPGIDLTILLSIILILDLFVILTHLRSIVLSAGFVSAHVVPVLYERYEDQVDDSFANLVGVLQKRYRKLDNSLKKMPKRGSFKSKKSE